MPEAAQYAYPMFGGWLGQWKDGQRWTWAMLIPNDDGSLKPVLCPDDRHFVAMLSSTRFLLTSYSKTGTGRRYYVWRPDDAVETFVLGIDPMDSVQTVISEHELLVIRYDARNRTEARIVDLDSGAASEITDGSALESPIRERYVLGRRSDGELIFSTTTVDGRRTIARWKPSTRVLSDPTVVSPDARIVGYPDDSTVILLEGGRRLVRHTWGTSVRTVLFPR